MKELYSVLSFILHHPLNAQHKRAALLRFLRWQVGSRLLRMKVLVPWVGEAQLLVGREDQVLSANVYAGLMAYGDMAFLLHALRPTDVFVDVGANVGAYTVLASKVVGARSIAFEPVLATVERLREQLRINDIADVVEVRNEGVGDRPGELFFTNNRDATNRVSLLDQGGAVTRVPVTTLDTALPSTGSYVIKIDVEGYEHHVLRGAEALLASHSVVALIIEHNPSSQEFGASVEQVHQKLLDAGFRPIAYEPRARVVTPLDTYDRANPNTVYVKDLEAVRARCETAPPCVVHTAFGVEL